MRQAAIIGLGFAIPINQVATIADLLIKNGKATYPVIGANVQDAAAGVELTDVDGQGPADKAGLRVKDVITKVDGHQVDTMEELIVDIRIRTTGRGCGLGLRPRVGTRSGPRHPGWQGGLSMTPLLLDINAPEFVLLAGDRRHLVRSGAPARSCS